MGVTPEQIRALVEPVVVARGFDLEDVRLRGPRDDLSVIVDRDGGSDLDVLADLSREVSERLDESDLFGSAPYTLEVTSPGIDRPLTTERQWRRALGRKVDVRYTDGDDEKQLTARVGPIEDGRIRLVRNERGRMTTTEVPLDAVTHAVVGVDFSRPGPAELAACGLDEDEIARRRSDA